MSQTGIALDAHGESKAKATRRFPRRNAEDVAFYRTAYRIAALEAEAFDRIARGHEANVELGRVFNQIKALLRHGEWKPYFAKKFAPRGIPLRTATAYMGLAREADERTKKADSALFPPATDPQAVAIREATEKQRRDVAKAKPESTYEASASTESKDEKPRTSLCMCRLQIRVTEKQRAHISALWRSEHRALADTQVIDLLTTLCSKYEISASSEGE